MQVDGWEMNGEMVMNFGYLSLMNQKRSQGDGHTVGSVVSLTPCTYFGAPFICCKRVTRRSSRLQMYVYWFICHHNSPVQLTGALRTTNLFDQAVFTGVFSAPPPIKYLLIITHMVGHSHRFRTLIKLRFTRVRALSTTEDSLGKCHFGFSGKWTCVLPATGISLHPLHIP